MYALGEREAEIFILLFLAPRKTEATTAGAVVLYVSQEAWLKSILDRNLPRDVESSDEEDINDYQFEDDLDYLRSLDPKEWKDQDHYAVLGITKLRNRATEDIIKKACKFLILSTIVRVAIGQEILLVKPRIFSTGNLVENGIFQICFYLCNKYRFALRKNVFKLFSVLPIIPVKMSNILYL